MTKLEKEIELLRADYPAIKFHKSSDPQVEDHEVILDGARIVQVSLNFRQFTPCVQSGDSFYFGKTFRSLKIAVENMPTV